MTQFLEEGDPKIFIINYYKRSWYYLGSLGTQIRQNSMHNLNKFQLPNTLLSTPAPHWNIKFA